MVRGHRTSRPIAGFTLALAIAAAAAEACRFEPAATIKGDAQSMPTGDATTGTDAGASRDVELAADASDAKIEIDGGLPADDAAGSPDASADDAAGLDADAAPGDAAVPCTPWPWRASNFDPCA